jgi:hypothetical protein
MLDAFSQILDHTNVEIQSPCNFADLILLRNSISGSVPDTLIDFWLHSNGAKFTTHNAELLSITQVCDLLSINVFGDFLQNSGLLPILDDHESNYVCVTTKNPLAPHVIYLLHDDSPKVLYHNPDSFFKDCINLLSSDDVVLYYYDTYGDYAPDAIREENDLITAKKLIQSGDDWKISIAVQLLDSNCLEEWNTVLNGNRFARQDALYRLNLMTTPAARDILNRDAREFDAFVKKVCDAATDAGVSLTRNNSAVCIRRQFIDFNAIFGDRHTENAVSRLVNWFKDIQKGINTTNWLDY